MSKLKLWLIVAACGGAAFFVASSAVAGPLGPDVAVTWVQVVQSIALGLIAIAGAIAALRINTGKILRDAIDDLRTQNQSLKESLVDRNVELAAIRAEVEVLKQRTDIEAVLIVLQQHADDSSRTLTQVSKLLDRISKRLDIQLQEA